LSRAFLYLIFIVPLFFACKKKETLPATSVKDAEYEKAKAAFNRNSDSAFYLLNQFTAHPRDSLNVAMAYNLMGAIQSDQGDYFGCEESLSNSLKFLNEPKPAHRQCLSSDYNELGMASLHLKNYDAALSYYERAINLADNPKFRAVIINNKAFAYQQKGQYHAALSIYQSIIAESKGDVVAYARALTNMSVTKWLANRSYRAAPELILAMHIREKAGDLWGLNSSYSHLADYYAAPHPDSAFFYASKMYAMAQKLNSPEDKTEGLEKMIRTGPPDMTKHYFVLYQRIDDSIQTARSAAKNQFALIRFDVEKSKATNLKLQNDLSKKRYQFIAIFIFVALGSIIAVIWSRKRKQRMELANRQAVRESQLKTSKRVHDTVANDIYRIMKKIENDPAVEKEWLLNDIEHVYERSRDISYEIVRGTDNDFHEQLATILISFATESTKVVVVGNSEEFWRKVNTESRFEIKYILQELMVNMKKHSGATNVVIRFEREPDECRISYADDGIGISKESLPKNGLTNTGNRIKAIHGKINFDTVEGKGLEVQITFPIV
jgi:signal transduction histidine kinase